jgi:hypothetical protein
MGDFTPSPEFEKKLQAAVSAPDADPTFVNRLRAQVIAAESQAKQPLEARPSSWWSRLVRGASASTGNHIMRPRLILPALAVVALIAAVFVFNSATTVSAQQILDRASAAQSALNSAQGIWHVLFETYQNPEAIPGDKAGTKTLTEGYYDLSANRYRSITRDAAGEILSVSASDGASSYSTNGPIDTSRTVYRTPQSTKSPKKSFAGDPDTAAKAVFDQFRNNPRVKLEGKVTWTDGSQAYILVNENYQTNKTPNGQDEQTLIGTTRAVFNAETYQLLEIQTLVHKDGNDILINSIRYLANEMLPATSPVNWSLGDLKGVVFADAPKTTQSEQSSSDVQSRTITEHELVQYGEAYVLKTVPEGFTQEIILHPSPAKDQPPTFEVNYTNPAGESFGMQAVGTMDPGFVETSFYDGSYKTAAGLTLHYTPSSNDSKTGGTSAMLVAPDGNSFLIASSLPREKVQALAEDLVPAK